MNKLLFSSKVKPIGLVLFLIGLIVGIIYLVTGYPEPDLFDGRAFALYSDSMFLNKKIGLIKNNLLDEFISVFIILGGILFAFSKEKVEDEFIQKIRLESLLWATYVNYIILFFSIIFIYGIPFFHILVINMFTVLIFFTARFRWALNRLR